MQKKNEIETFAGSGRWLVTLLILSFGLLSLLNAISSAQAQTPTPPLSPRETLIQAIQQKAQRDVERGNPKESAVNLEVLFGQEAATVGLSIAEVANVYEDAYLAAKPAEPWWAPLKPNAGWLVA